MILIILFQIVLSQDDFNFTTRIAGITNSFGEIRDMFENSYAHSIYLEINELQELMININSELAKLEVVVDAQTEHHSPLDIRSAEVTMRMSDQIIEKLALLDTRIININDRQILDKIEEYVLKMDEYDNYLRKSSKKLKEKLEKFKGHIKDDHRHYWLVMISAVTGIAIAISWRIISK